jgi:hypothetical protein
MTGNNGISFRRSAKCRPFAAGFAGAGDPAAVAPRAAAGAPVGAALCKIDESELINVLAISSHFDSS